MTAPIGLGSPADVAREHRARTAGRLRAAALGYGVAVVAVALVTAPLAALVDRLSTTTVALAYLLAVLLVAARFEIGPALLASVLATASFNFFFLQPLYVFTIADPQNWVALAAFLVTTGIAGALAVRSRRRAEDAVAGREASRRASAYNRSLIEASVDPMIAVDRDGAITDVNGATERLTGRSRTELLGTKLARCFAQPERIADDVRQALREGVVRNSTLAIRHRDGRTIPVLSNASVFRDDHGEIVGVFVVAREVGRAAPALVGDLARSIEPVAPTTVTTTPAVRTWTWVQAALHERGTPRLMLALVPPLAATALQLALWGLLRPYAWLLHYPALLVSAWVGGLRGGLVATATSTVLVWWLFLPPEHAFVKHDPRLALSAAMFVGLGAVFTVLQARLQWLKKSAEQAVVTEREGVQQLQRAHDEIARVVEQASDGILVADADGRILDVNGAGCRLLGAEREQLLGTAFVELLAVADAERLRRMNQQLAHGGVQVEELRLRRPDANELHVELSAKFLPDGRWQGIIRDVTERKRAERALQKNEADLNRAQAIAHIGSWSLDVPHNELSWSTESYRVFGIPIGTPLSYETFLAAVHPADRTAVDRAWTEAMAGAPYDIEHRIVVEGATRWVREKAELERDAEGRVRSGVGFVHDITERKQAEERLLWLNRAHRALSRGNAALVHATGEHALLQAICEVIVEEAGYRFCWVGRAEDDASRSVVPIAQAGLDDGFLVHAGIRWADGPAGRGPMGTALRERRPEAVQDIAADPSFAPWRDAALARGYASALAVPIVHDGLVAALSIYADQVDAFGDEAIALLAELAEDLGYGLASLRAKAERDRAQAELAALASELEHRVVARTAELTAAREREAEIGARIQRTLLLDEPPSDVRGLRIAALTLPSQRIAGDFYGFFHHEAHDCLDVLVADVMGKGVPAALLGAATKSHFPEALWQLLAGRSALPEPKDVITLAHAGMAKNLIGLESFVTACYARFDVARRKLVLVDCGHTGAVHLRPRTGACTVVHGDNLPLGIREGEVYDQREVELDDGDLVLLYSDGVTEARNAAGELFGEARLLATLTARIASEPAALVAAVRDAAVAFAGTSTLADDLTCMVVQLLAHEVPIARAELELRSSLGELGRARALVERFCSAQISPPLEPAALGALVLAVDEALSNVIKHAYAGRGDQRVELVAEAFADRVAIRLRHLGLPFDPTIVPPPSFDGSRESGFGVYLIARSVDAVRYRRDALQRNCIDLEKLR